MRRQVILEMMVFGLVALMNMRVAGAKDPLDLRLVEDFRSAVLAGDEEKIHATWIKLWKNKDLVGYMKEREPETFLLYKSHRLVERANRLQQQYGGSASDYSYGETSMGVETKERATSAIGSSKDPSNRSLIRKNLNSRQTPNNVRVKEAPNRSRLSNQETTRNAVNSGRRIKTFSNNRIYKRRYRPNRVR